MVIKLHEEGLSSRKIEAKLRLDYDFDITDRQIRYIIKDDKDTTNFPRE